MEGLTMQQWWQISMMVVPSKLGIFIGDIRVRTSNYSLFCAMKRKGCMILTWVNRIGTFFLRMGEFHILALVNQYQVESNILNTMETTQFGELLFTTHTHSKVNSMTSLRNSRWIKTIPLTKKPVNRIQQRMGGIVIQKLIIMVTFLMIGWWWKVMVAV